MARDWGLSLSYAEHQSEFTPLRSKSEWEPIHVFTILEFDRWIAFRVGQEGGWVSEWVVRRVSEWVSEWIEWSDVSEWVSLTWFSIHEEHRCFFFEAIFASFCLMAYFNYLGCVYLRAMQYQSCFWMNRQRELSSARASWQSVFWGLESSSVFSYHFTEMSKETCDFVTLKRTNHIYGPVPYESDIKIGILNFNIAFLKFLVEGSNIYFTIQHLKRKFKTLSRSNKEFNHP